MEANSACEKVNKPIPDLTLHPRAHTHNQPNPNPKFIAYNTLIRGTKWRDIAAPVIMVKNLRLISNKNSAYQPRLCSSILWSE